MFDRGPPRLTFRDCRLVCRMNLDHTVGDIRQFINAYVRHLSHFRFTNDLELIALPVHGQEIQSFPT